MQLNISHLIKKSSVIASAIVCTSVFSSAAIAQSSQERGLEISKESKQRDLGWGDVKSSMQMILRNKQGEKSIREMVLKSLEQENDGDKSLTVFNKPRDVKGTAFLSFSHIQTPDDQWLYLPALKRVKRISSRNKSGPFMGSEFAFEDLSSFEIDKYSYNYLGDETVNGFDSFKVEQTPKDKFSGYTRRIVWLDKAEYRAQKIDFYDRKNSLLKTLVITDYKQYLNKFWRANSWMINNHQTGKSTELIYKNYQFGTGLKESDFNKNSLKRAR